jgi:hypothetical protein
MPDIEVPLDYRNPALMAIGDSLFNGCRSMTVSDALAQHSVPGMIASAIGIPPQGWREGRYPGPDHILIDIEQALHRVKGSTLLGVVSGLLGKMPGFVKEAQDNTRAWMACFAQPGPVSGRPWSYDNLAVAGAEAGDLFAQTAADYDNQLARMVPKVLKQKNPSDWSEHGRDNAVIWNAVNLHLALNARHKLNPSNAPGLMRATALDIVQARAPHTLLVNVGANHGLGDIALTGNAQRGIARLQTFAQELMPVHARLLAKTARRADIQRVVFTLVPRPSQIFNLMPAMRESASDYPQPLQPGGMFQTYVPHLAFPPDAAIGYTGTEMLAIDHAVDRIRQQVTGTLERAFADQGIADRLLLIDYAAIFDRFDSKHDIREKIVVNGQTYTSHAFNHLAGNKAAIRGGLSGLDNFHPSLVGYRILAREIALAMDVAPAGIDATIPLTAAGDTLLATPPQAAMILLRAIAWLRFGEGIANMPAGSQTAKDFVPLSKSGLLDPADALRRLLQLGPVRM